MPNDYDTNEYHMFNAALQQIVTWFGDHNFGNIEPLVNEEPEFNEENDKLDAFLGEFVNKEVVA